MKGLNAEQLLSTEHTPAAMASEWIEFCLKQLSRDRMHHVTEEIVHGLTFEEVLGALLSASQAIRGQERT